jgi:hypothetical protein
VTVFAPSNGQPKKPAWDANLPNCWAVGATNLWHAVKGTISPLPSVSTGIGVVGGGGDLILSGTKAVSSKAGFAALLGGLDWNLASGILDELENPLHASK